MAMDVNIWIRDPYPFWTQERAALERALRLTYGNQSLVYFQGFPAHYVSILNTNMTTCKRICETLRTVHLMHAHPANLTDKEYCQHFETVILGAGDKPPAWAKEQTHGN